jgi:hypothetical protein
MVSYSEMKKQDPSSKPRNVSPMMQQMNRRAAVNKQIALRRAEEKITQKLEGRDPATLRAEERIKAKANSIEAEAHSKDMRFGSFGILEWGTNKKTGMTAFSFCLGQHSSRVRTLSKNAKDFLKFASAVAVCLPAAITVYPHLENNREKINAAVFRASDFPAHIAQGTKTIVTKSAERVITAIDDWNDIKKMEAKRKSI